MKNKIFTNLFCLKSLMILAVCFAALNLRAETVNKLSYSQNTMLKVSLSNAPLSELFAQIEEQSEFVFVYNTSTLNDKTEVSVNESGSTINNVLDIALSDTPYTYDVNDRQVSVYNRSEASVSNSPAEADQKRTVKGKVLDENGAPMIGVMVNVVGTSVATITDGTGAFAIKAEPTSSLQASYVGYEDTTVAANQDMVTIQMKADAIEVDEVVVVGYGVQKKANLTGAVMQVGAEELESRPVANASQMLQGAMPNVNISFSTGAPDAEGSISVRGQASINGGEPLVLIDGVPGDIDRINPSDVESVSVLKDASSSAIYGARGAFGVILVTTKKGKAGKMRITYNTNLAVSSPTVSTDFMTNGYETTMLCDEAFRRTTGNTYTRYSEDDYAELEARRYDTVEDPSRPWTVIKNVNGKDIYNYYGNYNWWDTMFTSQQFSHQHDLSLSGGNDKINYMISGSYYHKDGVMKINNDKYKKYNFRSKIEAQVLPFLKITNNTQYFDSSYDYYGRENGSNSNFVYVTVHALPAYAPLNPDGTATYNTLKNGYSIGDGIFAQLMDGQSKGANRLHEFRTTTSAQLDLGKYVKFNADYTFAASIKDNYYRASVAHYSIEPGVLAEVPNYNTDQYKQSMSFDPMQVFNGYFNFNKSFNDKHNLSAVAGVNYEYSKTAGLSASRKNLISEELNDLNLGTGDMLVGGGQSEYALLGAFARVNYDYEGKYLVEFSGRYDGTSKYKEGMRFGFFPSFSAGWRISEEGFFAPLKRSVNNLKFRFSYGSLGNQLSGSNMYPYISTMGMNLSSWLIDGAKTQTISAPSPITDNLTWEVATTSNIGIDAAFFNNRLTFSGDAYIRDTEDMLIPGQVLPAVFGASSPKQNSGNLRTKGYELILSWRDKFNLGGDDFNYSVQATFGDATSEITKYDNPNKLLSSYYEGMKVGEIWGYHIDGMFATNEEASSYKVDQALVNYRVQTAAGEWAGLRAGDLRYVDLDGNNIINTGTNTLDDPGDRTVIGNKTPRYNYGVNIGADWKGFDLSAFFQGIGKRSWYPGTNADKFWGPFSRPYFSFTPEGFTDLLWSEENPDSYFPVLRGYSALATNSSLGAVNNRYIQNIGYLRLKNLVLGYTLPKQVLDKMKIDQLRFYVSAENLFTWTPLETDYIDPEQAAIDSNGRTYPLSKSISFGINLTF